MKKNNILRSRLSKILPIGLLFFLFAFSQWSLEEGGLRNALNKDDANEVVDLTEAIAAEDKQKGAHVFGIVDSTNFEPLIENNLEWVTLVSWGFQKDIDSPHVGHHNGDDSNILRHNAHWVKRIQLVRSAGFKVFFKPHVWISAPSDGKWRSDIYPTNEENWASWQKTYTDFILRYARVAEDANAEMYCIGAEFSRLAVEKPDYWRSLIEEVRCVYSGKITYAANWYKEFDQITFWDQLDFIGIQAYFPLAEGNCPSVTQISNGWNQHLPAIESTHERFNKKVIFTEMGYRSTANSAIKPWEWAENSCSVDSLYSVETQANCYEAFFNTVWKKDWFAGVHFWQLRTDFVAGRGRSDFDFTPQGKPAEIVMAKGYE